MQSQRGLNPNDDYNDQYSAGASESPVLSGCERLPVLWTECTCRRFTRPGADSAIRISVDGGRRVGGNAFDCESERLEPRRRLFASRVSRCGWQLSSYNAGVARTWLCACLGTSDRARC